MKILPIIALLSASLSSFAQVPPGIALDAAKKIHFDCYLPTDSLSCDELKESFYNANGGITPGSESESFVSITVRSLSLNNIIEYQYTLKGLGDLPQISFKYPLNDSLSVAERFIKVLSMTNKLTEPYKLVAGHTTQTGGGEDKPYYISPSIGGYGSSGQGVKDFMGYGYLEGTYSTSKWKIVGDLGLRHSYSSVETTAFSPGMTTNTFRQGGGIGIIRTVKKNWNFAVLAADIRVSSDIHMEDPNHGIPENGLNNSASKTVIAAGAEWILVPFLKEESNGNIAVRYILGGEHHKYMNPETYEYIQEEFAKHTVEFVVSKHFKKVDLDFKTSAFRSQWREETYSGVSAGTNVSYKINKNLTLDVSGGIEYAKGRIQSPAAGNASFISLTNGNKSATTYSGSISLKYTLGNTRRKNSDQRFKR